MSDATELRVKKIVPCEKVEFMGYYPCHPCEVLSIYLKGKYGIYYTKINRVILQMEYDSVKIFSNGFLLVRNGKKSGLFSIDSERFTVPMGEYDIKPFHTQTPQVRQVGIMGVFAYGDPKYYLDDFYILGHNGKFGVFSVGEQKTILPIEYDYIEEVSPDRMVIVKLDDKEGLFSLHARKFMVDPQCDHIHLHIKGIYCIEMSSKYGLFSVKANSLVVPIECDEVYRSYDNFCIIRQLDKYGLFSSEAGKLVLPLECTEIKKHTSHVYPDEIEMMDEDDVSQGEYHFVLGGERKVFDIRTGVIT